MKRHILIAIVIILISLSAGYLFTKIPAFQGQSSEPIYLPGFTPRPDSFISPVPTPLPSALPSGISTGGIILIPNVPFTPQAPLANWNDQRQESGCEEAVSLMAVSWAQEKQFTLQEAEQQIIAISDYESKTYGDYHDTSVQDTIDRIFGGYFHYDNVEAKYGITADNIKSELAKGNLVLVSTNGQKLNNPYYRPPGPLQHMLVIRGYDSNADEFITNDPGTKRGELYKYPVDTVMDAIYDYPTGNNEHVDKIIKAMIVVWR